jgi:hypothetical protein
MTPKSYQQHTSNSSRMRMLSATIGASALVVMGALTFSLSGDDRGGTIVSEPGTYTEPTTSEMTTGETTKSSIAEATETVSPPFASPPVTAEPAETAEPG